MEMTSWMALAMYATTEQPNFFDQLLLGSYTTEPFNRIENFSLNLHI